MFKMQIYFMSPNMNPKIIHESKNRYIETISKYIIFWIIYEMYLGLKYLLDSGQMSPDNIFIVKVCSS